MWSRSAELHFNNELLEDAKRDNQYFNFTRISKSFREKRTGGATLVLYSHDNIYSCHIQKMYKPS